MLKLLSLLLPVLVWVLLSSCSRVTAQKKEILPFVGQFQVMRYTLENGLKILIVPDHSSPTFAYQTWFAVGSRDEKPQFTGLAHLFEHMMFKGTKTRKESVFDQELERVGAQGMNAFTNRDYTAYVQELPKSQLDLIATLESDRMVNLVVDEKSFKTETEVVQNERRLRVENSPDGKMYQALFEASFDKHPYQWPVIGYAEDLERMHASDAKAFYDQHYRPDQATLILVGDLDPNQTVEKLSGYYSKIPKSTQRPTDKITTEYDPPQKVARKKIVPIENPFPKLMVGYHIPEVSHPDSPALELIEIALARGKSSRLQQALVETGLASSIYGFELEDKDPTLLSFAINLQKGVSVEKVEAVLLEEIKKISTTPFTKAEIERAKNALAYAHYRGLSDSSSKANFLGKSELVFGSFEKALERFEKQKNFTEAELMAAASRNLKPENRVVIVGKPKGGGP